MKISLQEETGENLISSSSIQQLNHTCVNNGIVLHRNSDQIYRTRKGQPRKMIRAKSYGGAISTIACGATKCELENWRKKFGKREAGRMSTGLQKLQDAFAKGMNLTDTYGYPTSSGRYVRVGK